MKKLNLKGFSLVELLVVITIIAILSVVAYTAVGGQTIKAKDAKRKQDIATLQSSIEIYMAQNGVYPATLASLVPTYISKILKDPASTTTDYKYVIAGDKKTYLLGTTLQDPASTAYVVGNGTALTMSGYGVGVTGSTAACAAPGDLTVLDGSVTCVPYNP